MAPRTQQNLATDERTEREFALDVNAAVANTEGEIAAFAMGDDEPENDADTSLEEMGEGLEGDDLEEEGGEDEAEVEAADGKGDEPEAAEGDDEDDAEPEAQQPQADERRQEFRGVPPGVHRDRVQAQRQRAETAEQVNQRLERELAETRGRLDMLAQTVNSQPKAQAQQEQRPDPEPDMFVDPEGWKSWNRKQIQAETAKLVDQRLGGFQQQQLQREETRINQSFAEAASGPRSWEFDRAYRTLIGTLDPRNAQDKATVARITNSADPAAALFGWFEENGAEEYRASVAEQLGLEPAQAERPRQSNRQQPRQQQGQPRQVYRMPPSLNAARGGSGNRQGQQANPDMQDDSDRSTFDFAMR